MDAAASPARSRIRLLLRAAVAALIAAMLMLIMGGPALAHSDLVRSDPVDGGGVDGVTRPVTLEFSEELDAGSVSIRLIGSSGFQAQLAPPTTTRTVVVQPLPTLINDRYVLRYVAVASDGHPVDGTISFTVSGSVVGRAGGPAHGQHAAPPTGTAHHVEAAGHPPTHVWAWLVGGAVAIGGSVVAVRWLIGRRRAPMHIGQ
ncbi:copper resistance CopC family protein [Pseudonocardia broussonetiae]|uniref:Copper resistance protein CopC n=1 Tax=Pseudonocardia broussonetiae TaxID=2736640 RepID=A0A6M6JLJ8_9PSEU|nr:copper resistance CopC family protein [Pseudonocardia broussonetiae]QJY47827.1 copper resistance protein CopC [Pseudonocardia broussonetiae]